jgi:acid phosphatase
MRRRTLLLTAAAMLAALVPAGARAQDPATRVPAPQPIVITLGTTPTVQLFNGGSGLPYLGATAPYNAGALVPALTAFHDSGVYDREIAQIDAIADRWVRGRGRSSGTAARAARVARRDRYGDRRNGRNRGSSRMAVVLDIDETSLSNYSANEAGKAIAPTLQVFNDARARGIAIFFVTGRPETQRQVTVENLEREGFHNWQGLTLKPVGSTLTTVAYKSAARAAVEQLGFRIIANIGDQYSDLAGGHADRAFKIPNPFYFLP